MIKPLQSGDSVGIVAPGKKIQADPIHAAIQIFQSWGLHTTVGKNVFSEKHSYLAGTDEERLEDFQKMLDDPQIKAIVCARGGYGSSRILDTLDFTGFSHHPKWIVGFSDVTAIHLKLLSLGYESIHGIMPILFSPPEYESSVASLKQVLFGDPFSIAASPHQKNRFGKAEGNVIGGNLSLLADSLGTSTEPDTHGKILVIEEVEEYFYKIDRMLTQLSRAKKLESLAGLIVGHMTNISDTEIGFGESIEEIVMHAVGKYMYPVSFGFPIGHDHPNLAWKHGHPYVLTVDRNGAVLKF